MKRLNSEIQIFIEDEAVTSRRRFTFYLRSSFIHSEIWLQNILKILLNISKIICWASDHWIIKMLKSCGLWSLKVKKWICCGENKRRKETKVNPEKKLFSNSWFSFTLSLSQWLSFLPFSHIYFFLKTKHNIIREWLNSEWQIPPKQKKQEERENNQNIWRYRRRRVTD